MTPEQEADYRHLAAGKGRCDCAHARCVHDVSEPVAVLIAALDAERKVSASLAGLREKVVRARNEHSIAACHGRLDAALDATPASLADQFRARVLREVQATVARCWDDATAKAIVAWLAAEAAR